MTDSIARQLITGAQQQYIPEPLGFPSNLMAMLGLNTPIMRFLAGFTFAESIMFAFKPRFAFDRNGDMLEWTMNSRNGSIIPWFGPGLLLGAYLAVFV